MQRQNAEGNSKTFEVFIYVYILYITESLRKNMLEIVTNKPRL
jgi:hypothetical protein